MTRCGNNDQLYWRDDQCLPHCCAFTETPTKPMGKIHLQFRAQHRISQSSQNSRSEYHLKWMEDLAIIEKRQARHDRICQCSAKIFRINYDNSSNKARTKKTNRHYYWSSWTDDGTERDEHKEHWDRGKSGDHGNANRSCREYTEQH